MDNKSTGVSNEPEEPLCGVCGKGVPGQLSSHYLATCDVCHRRCSIHSKKNCALKLWENSPLKKANKLTLELSQDVFNQQKSLGLFCSYCKDPCFVCKTISHDPGKNMFDIYVYEIFIRFLVSLQFIFSDI